METNKTQTAERSEIIARRRTADSVGVCLWSDGAISGVLGFKLPGVPMRRPRTAEARDRALCAGWLLLGEVELWDLSEVPALYRAAEKAARGDRLPGTLRDLMAQAEKPAIALSWTVTSADRNGRPTERQARLPRLRWPGMAVIDYCGTVGSARGRYVLVRVEHGDVAFDTGFAFTSQRDLFAHLLSEAGAVSTKAA